MAGRFSNPVPQYLSDAGAMLDGGLLYFYETGSSTILQDTWSDADLSTLNANPVELDSSGRLPSVFAPYTSVYNVVLKTAGGVTIWSRDPCRFVDVQEIADLIDQIEQDIANLLSITTGAANPVRNASCDSVSIAAAPNLTGSLLQGPVLNWYGRVTGTVSAGTLTQGTKTNFGSAQTQLKFSAVTGDSTSVIEAVSRISAYDARRFYGKTCSVSVLAFQESGVTADCNVLIGKATAANDFSTVTNIADVAQTLSTGTSGTLKAEGVAMGDCSNGIEIRIKIKPGATFTTKDFYLCDLQFIDSATAPTFIAKTYPMDVDDSHVNEVGVFLDSGTADALVVNTNDYVFSIYDGFRIAIRKGASDSATTTPTLNVNSLGATTIKRNDGSACIAGDMQSGGSYQFVYSVAASAWLLQNPYIVTSAQIPLATNGNINCSTSTGYPVTLTVNHANNVSGAQKIDQGTYKVTFSVAYPNAYYSAQVNPVEPASNVKFASVIEQTATDFTFEIWSRNDGSGITNADYFTFSVNY